MLVREQSVTRQGKALSSVREERLIYFSRQLNTNILHLKSNKTQDIHSTKKILENASKYYFRKKQ